MTKIVTPSGVKAEVVVRKKRVPLEETDPKSEKDAIAAAIAARAVAQEPPAPSGSAVSVPTKPEEPPPLTPNRKFKGKDANLAQFNALQKWKGGTIKLHLLNGARISGVLVDYDQYTLTVANRLDEEIVIYKTAIATCSGTAWITDEY